MLILFLQFKLFTLQMRYLRSSERPFSEQWRIAEAPGMLVQSSRIEEEEEEGKIEIVSSA